MIQFLQDLRFAGRTLLKSPGFTIAALFTLALGIGANSAIFSVINTVMLRPLPYPEPKRLVVMWGTDNRPLDALMQPAAKGLPRNKTLVISSLVERWRELNASFENVAYYRGWIFSLTGAGEPERIYAGLISSSFFPALKVAPALGRPFLLEEEEPGKDRVVILGHGFWQRRFAADPGIIGKTIMLDGVAHTVLGVMPAGLHVLLPYMSDAVDLWAPISHNFTPKMRWEVCTAIGRLKPGIGIRQAQAEMDTISKRLESESRRNVGRGVNLALLSEQIAGEIRPALLILFGAVGCVLLIGCANLANLMLARTAARYKEIAVRTVLGAGRLRLVRQLLTESLLLALAGGALGLLLSSWIVRLITLLHPGHIPRLAEVRADAWVFAFCLAISVLTGILFGLLPAWQFSKPDVNQALKEGGGRAGGGSRSRHWRNVLVAAEVALALVLLTGAGLLLRSFILLKAVDPGFRTENLLTMSITLPEATYRQPHERVAFVEQVLERVRPLPAVQYAAFSNSLPMASGFSLSMDFTIEGRQTTGERLSVFVRAVTADYFRTLAIALLKGRYFTDADFSRADAVIINQAMARRYWGPDDPVGQRLNFEEKKSREIIGVVADVKNFGIESGTGMEVYVPFPEAAYPYLGLAVRTASDPTQVAAAVRAAVRAVDRNLPLESMRSMQQILNSYVARPRFNLVLLGSFAAVALLLAAVGIYGVIAYSVTQRTHEIGVRMAMGAQPADVLRQVVGHGMLPVLAGVLIGVAASLAATRLLTSFLFSIRPNDAATFTGVTLVVILIAFLASYLPARRATRVDPLVALRYE